MNSLNIRKIMQAHFISCKFHLISKNVKDTTILLIICAQLLITYHALNALYTYFSNKFLKRARSAINPKIYAGFPGKLISLYHCMVELKRWVIYRFTPNCTGFHVQWSMSCYLIFRKCCRVSRHPHICLICVFYPEMLHDSYVRGSGW